MAFHFDSRDFFAAHGTEPRGRGWWIFEGAGDALGIRTHLPSMTVTEAKAVIRRSYKDEAKGKDFSFKILP